jgi:hypothetical protein
MVPDAVAVGDEQEAGPGMTRAQASSKTDHKRRAQSRLLQT